MDRRLRRARRPAEHPRVAFLPFRNLGMELTTYLAIRRTDPPAGLDLLLKACAVPGTGRDADLDR